MQKIGYGALQLKPWEMGQLTPAEFAAMFDGYLWRKERDEHNMRWLAWHIAALPNLREPLTYAEFMGEKPKEEQIQRVPWQELQARIRGSLPQ